MTKIIPNAFSSLHFPFIKSIPEKKCIFLLAKWHQIHPMNTTYTQNYQIFNQNATSFDKHTIYCSNFFGNNHRYKCPNLCSSNYQLMNIVSKKPTC